MKTRTNETAIRDAAAGAAVGILATWLVARALGSRNLALALGSGALVGALRASQAMRSGRGFAFALLLAFGATATAALRRSA